MKRRRNTGPAELTFVPTLATAMGDKNWPVVRSWIERKLNWREHVPDAWLELWSCDMWRPDWSDATWRGWFKKKLHSGAPSGARRCPRCPEWWVISRHPRRVYCSASCRVRACQLGYGAPRGTTRKCEWCGTPFVCVREAQHCCSHVCRSKRSRARAKAKELRKAKTSWRSIAEQVGVSVVVVRRWGEHWWLEL